MGKLCSLVFAAIFLFAVSAQAQGAAAVTCEITATGDCTDGSIIFKVSGTTDAHAALHDQGSFLYGVCCHGLEESTRVCSPADDPSNLVVRLSGTDDAHASTGTNFQTDVCFNDIICVASDDCAPFGEEYFCLAALSDQATDAHVGACSGDFPTKLCCSESGEAPDDVQAPNTVLDDYYPDPTINTQLDYTGTSTDYGGSQISSIQYRYSDDGGDTWSEWADVDNFTPAQAVEFGFTSPELDIGTYSFEVKATDTAGNEEAPDDDSSDTVTISSAPVCGNGVVETGEECDCGTTDPILGVICSTPELGSETCESLGYESGSLSCHPECHDDECTFDISGCEDSGLPPSQVCSPNEKRCFGNNLKQCNTAGTAWTTYQSCSYGCNPATESCYSAPQQICTPGEKRCLEDSLQQCDSAGKEWVTIEECEMGCENGACTEEPPAEPNYLFMIIVAVVTVAIIAVLASL